jgi:hypothetical protein
LLQRLLNRKDLKKRLPQKLKELDLRRKQLLLKPRELDWKRKKKLLRKPRE